MHECRKCPYFRKEQKKEYTGGRVIVGECSLRGKKISDVTLTNTSCKDRAVI